MATFVTKQKDFWSAECTLFAGGIFLDMASGEGDLEWSTNTDLLCRG